MRKNNFKEVIKILPENSFYRVGDIFNGTGNPRWLSDRQEILSNPLYRGTILYRYLKGTEAADVISNDFFRDKTGEAVEKDYAFFKECVDYVGTQGNFEKPSSSELVIHVRLGDVFIEKHFRCRKRVRLLTERYHREDFFDNIDMSSIDKVTVVTAMHFGASTKGLSKEFSKKLRKEDRKKKYFFSEAAVDASIEFISDFENRVNQAGYELNIFSNEDIDRDIFYMCRSMHFVPTESGISDLLVRSLDTDSKVYNI